jgi:hypothetical protein
MDALRWMAVAVCVLVVLAVCSYSIQQTGRAARRTRGITVLNYVPPRRFALYVALAALLLCAGYALDRLLFG